MREKQGNSKKEEILKNARLVFSHSGYDAASVDEIAAKTGVPKSTVYYHFKSKEGLLQSVIEQFLTEYEKLLSENWDVGNACKPYLDFLDENSDFLRIIIIESMKKNDTVSSVFKVIERLMFFESRLGGNSDLTVYEKSHERWVAEFYTSIIPSIFYSCYKEKWCECFNTDLTLLKSDFVNAYKKTHGAYHENLESNEKAVENALTI